MQGQRIAVLGCGPSGMAIALFLHRAGHEVEIFERFDAVRPLGSGLLIQPSGQRVFAALGLLAALRNQSSLVNRMTGISLPSGKRALDVDFADLGGTDCALGVHRAVLFNVLHAAVVAAGITVNTGCEISLQSIVLSRSSIELRVFGSEYIFDMAVDAMGSRSPLLSGRITPLPFGAFWATVDSPEQSDIGVNSLDQRYLSARQMAGIMPIGISPFSGKPASAIFWSARERDAAAICAGGVDQWRSDFCKLWPEAEPFVQSVPSFSELTFAHYHHRTGRMVTGQRLFHIGDSWRCTSPQLGQGANMALIDAAALAQSIQGCASVSEIAPTYAALRGRHARIYQALSRVFTPLYQSDGFVGPWLRDQIVHHTGGWRLVRKLVARVVSGEFGNGFRIKAE